MVTGIRNRVRIVELAILLLLSCGASGKGYAPPGPLPGHASPLQTCRDEMNRLGLRPSDSMRSVDRHGSRYYIFVTRDREDMEHLVACAGDSGSVVQSVGLDRL